MTPNTLKFDLMKSVGSGERFVATMRYPHSPLFKLDLADLYKWILGKRPTLKDEVVRCYFDDTAIGKITFFPKSKHKYIRL